ncbi:MAG: alanine--tRNA ligase, partial [Chloroflexi bacterium]|nr:alanine--tRNA ligase [Chloroflexota bacterium]
MTRPTTIDQVRQAYLDFFQAKDHLVVPSASLIPAGDPTLLFTSAGMVQFKSYFSGEERPPSPRLTSSQKCFRTSDIDEVGDPKHLTFFEMLGNFSIGDYFKKEAIAWAWEFCTQVLQLPEERLWITVFLDDDEAEAIWREIGVPPERILRYGEEHNYWGPAGEEGPCGPCSEIHYDYGEEYGPDATPAEGGERFVEIWNLVFTQFHQRRDGSRTPLPTPNIDTGMGLERTAAIMQDVRSVYQTDAFDYLVERGAELAKVRYGEDDAMDYALRVLAEHARAVTFLIADGVAPSNLGRGYVLRRILRRAVRYARKAGVPPVEGGFLSGMAEAVIQRMGPAYPELERERDFVYSVIRGEEQRFGETLEKGQLFLDGFLAEIPKIEKGLHGAESFLAILDQVPEARRGVEHFLSPAQSVGGTGISGWLEAQGALEARQSIVETLSWDLLKNPQPLSREQFQ